MLVSVAKMVEIGFKTIGWKVAGLKVVSALGMGLEKVYTCKVVLVGGKVIWVTAKVIGGIIVGATISQAWIGGGQ